jgi:hypothetical protein
MKKVLKFKILNLIIFISYLGFGQEFNSGTNQKDFYTEFRYEWINEKIIIPVEIEGQIYRFLLDTGAPNLITTNLNKKITTNFKQTIPITDANNKKDSLDLVTIPLIKISGISYFNIPSLVSKTETNLIFDCFKIDGLIGSNLLRNSIIQILPKEKLIKLTDDKKKLSLKRKNSTEIEFPDIQSTPYVWIELNSNGIANDQVYVDTGMSGFYTMANGHLEIFQKDDIFKIDAETKGSQGTGLFGSENENTYYQLIVPKIEINKAIFNEITVVTTSDNNSRIGSEILLYGNVTIDFLNKRFYYEPFENIVDLREKTFGFIPTIIDDKFVIGLVWADDLKDKIKFGDQILEINGRSLLNSDFCDLITEKNIFKNNEKLDLILLQKDGEKKALIVNKNYR